MDDFSIWMLVFIAAIGVYKLADGFKDLKFGLTAICFNLDAINKNAANDSKRIVSLLAEQNALLQRLVEQQRDK